MVIRVAASGNAPVQSNPQTILEANPTRERLDVVPPHDEPPPLAVDLAQRRIRHHDPIQPARLRRPVLLCKVHRFLRC